MKEKKLKAFDQWLAEAKAYTDQYINNLLTFIEDKKQTEIKNLNASFIEESTKFKETLLPELEKTLVEKLSANIVQYHSQYEEKIAHDLLDFTAQEREKVNQKIIEIEKTTKDKLVDLDSELDYIKDLPQTIENQYLKLKKELTVYQQKITTDIHELSTNKTASLKVKMNEYEQIYRRSLNDQYTDFVKKFEVIKLNLQASVKELNTQEQKIKTEIETLGNDKTLNFKEKITTFSETFTQQLDYQYTDFVQKTEIIKLDIEETKKQFQLHNTNITKKFKEQIKEHAQTILSELAAVHREYQVIKGDIHNQFPKTLNDFKQQIIVIRQDIEKLQKQHFNEKEKIANFHKWLKVAQTTSHNYLNQLLQFIEQTKAEQKSVIVSLIKTFAEEIKKEYQKKKAMLNTDLEKQMFTFEKMINVWLDKNKVLQALERQALEKNEFLEKIFLEFNKNEKRIRSAMHQKILKNENQHSTDILKKQKILEKKIDLKSKQLHKNAEKMMMFFEQNIKNKLSTIESDLLKNNQQIINRMREDLLVILKSKKEPQLNYLVQQKESSEIKKRLKTLEGNLGISQISKNRLDKMSQQKNNELAKYQKEFNLMKKTFLKKEFLLEEKFQNNIEFLNQKYYKQIKIEQKHLTKQKTKINELIEKHHYTLNESFKEAQKIKVQLIKDFEKIINKSEYKNQTLVNTLNQSITKATKDIDRFKIDHQQEVIAMTNDLKKEIDTIESKWSKNLKSKFAHLNQEINTITEKIDIFLEQSDLFVKVDQLTEKAQMDIKSYQQMIKNIEKKSTIVDSIHQKLSEAKNLEGQVEVLHSQINLEKQDFDTIKKDLNNVKSLSESLQQELSQFEVNKKEIKQYLHHIEGHREKLASVQNIIDNFSETKSEVTIVTEQIKDIVSQNKNLQKNSYKMEQIEKKINFIEQSYAKINIDKALLLDFDKRYETFGLMLDDLGNRETEINHLLDSLTTKEDSISNLLNKIDKEVNYYREVLSGKMPKKKLLNATADHQNQKNNAKDLVKLESTVHGLLALGWAVKDIAKNLDIDPKIISQIKEKIKRDS